MEHTTWADASAQGAKHYFTGKPCIRGHVAPRFVSNTGCTECAKMTPAEKEAFTMPRTLKLPNVHPDDCETLRIFAECLRQARLNGK